MYPFKIYILNLNISVSCFVMMSIVKSKLNYTESEEEEEDYNRLMKVDGAYCLLDHKPPSQFPFNFIDK